MTEEPSYLTAAGLERLKAELEQKKGPEREALALRLRSAIQQGDLSENADYSAAKEDQAFLEGRIQELERILRNVVVIDESVKRNIVDIGARITIQELDDPSEETYHMVGPKEADPIGGRISHESPIGRALLGHRTGDVVNVETPNGVIQFKILKIE